MNHLPCELQTNFFRIETKIFTVQILLILISVFIILSYNFTFTGKFPLYCGISNINEYFEHFTDN